MSIIFNPSFLFCAFLAAIIFEGIDGQTSSWLNGHATFYGANQNLTTLGGACGYDNTFDAGFGTSTAAVSGALFRGGEACGACYRVACDYELGPKWCLRRGVVTITATNLCPPNNGRGWCDPPRHHFDMSMPAFSGIARPGDEGIVPVLYTRVSCRRKGGVRFTLKGVVTLRLCGSEAQLGLQRRRGCPCTGTWGANWQGDMDLRSQTLSFKLMLVDGKILEFFNVVPSSYVEIRADVCCPESIHVA